MKPQLEKILEGIMCWECQKQHDDKLKLAISQILKLVESVVPEEKDICYSKINMGFADSREYRQEGWNECIAEIKERLK